MHTNLIERQRERPKETKETVETVENIQQNCMEREREEERRDLNGDDTCMQVHGDTETKGD